MSVLAGARRYLTASGRVFLSVSSQYGMRRVMGLLNDAPSFRYRGLLASTDWVPFDLARPDLLECLRLYAQEETRGGLSYDFHDPAASGDQTRTATAALERYEQFGESPLMKRQTHLFESLDGRSSQLTLRFVTTSDIDQLAEWNHQLIHDEGHRNRMTVPELADRMRGWLEQDYRAIVFELAGTPVAYALFREQPAEIYLRQLFVVRERRRLGIGKRAIELLRRKCGRRTNDWPSRS